MVTTRQMKEYIERRSEERIENAIKIASSEKTRDDVERFVRTQIDTFADNIEKAYQRKNKWFIYANKTKEVSAGERTCAYADEHFLLTFSSDKDYKRALEKMRRHHSCQTIVYGEITAEMIERFRR